MHDPCVFPWFCDTARRAPDRIALEEPDRQITYAELRARAAGVAALLRREGIGRGDVVGIFAPEGIAYVAAMLGALEVGAVFLPISVEAPERRLAQLLERAAPRVVVAPGSLVEVFQMRAAAAGSADLPVLALEEAPGDASAGAAAGAADAAAVGPDDGCYLVTSSGSTGRPKAILGRQKSLAHFLRWEIREFGLDEQVRTCQLAPTPFDVSLRDLFVPLACGGAATIPDRETRLSPRRLLDWLEQRRVTLLHIVPSVFRLLLHELESGARSAPPLPALRHVLLAGEPLYGSDVSRFRRLCGDRICLVNLYGPTESTLAKLFNRLDGQEFAPAQIVPLGKPIANTAALVMRDGALCRIGEVGEIFIKTPFLSKGYYRDPALTAERFVPNPLTNDPRDVVYRTGDLGRYLSDRSVAFVGREDDQVKVRGVRIELGEIESAACDHPDIVQAVAAAPEGRDHERRLALYYRSARAIPAAELRAHLERYLPEQLAPSSYVRVEAFPTTATGKIDRRALPAPDAPPAAQDDPPVSDAERRVAAIWAGVLERQGIGRRQHFFEVGGHSLRAMRVLSQLYRDFGVEVSLRDFLAEPTIEHLAKLVERPGAKGAYEPIPRAPASGPFPLSSAQRRLWLIHRTTGDSRPYHIASLSRVTGPVDAGALRRAFAELTARHEALRTVLLEGNGENGEPRQLVGPSGPELEVVDLEGASEAESRARALGEEIAARPFDLTGAPLWRARWIRLGPTRGLLAVCFHHLVADAWSLDLLARELWALYRAATSGSPLVLAPLSVQSRDCVAWQAARLASPELAADRDYWHRALGEGLPPLELPLDAPRAQRRSSRGARVRSELGPELAAALERAGSAEGATLFEVLLSAFEALLQRLTGQEDFVVGTAVAGRIHPDLEPQVGCYANTLALRCRARARDRLTDLLAEARRLTLEAHEHQAYPFELLADELARDREPGRAPLFDVGLVLHQPGAIELPPGLGLEAMELPQQTAKFDLLLVGERTESGLRIDFQYATELFAERTIRQLALHFERVLRALAETPERRVGDLSLVQPGEPGWPGPAPILAGEPRSISAAFRAVARERAAELAMVAGERSWSYADLRRAAGQVARHLHRESLHGAAPGLAPEAIVGVEARDSEWAVIALLGILEAGGTYLPLDPDLPEERLRFMLEDSRCRRVLRQGEVGPLPSGVSAIDLCGLLEGEPADAGTWGARGAADAGPHPRSLAYVIYTSGSTGRPKGVAVEHAGFVSMVRHQIEAFGVRPGDRVLQFASTSFDASLSEIFMALLAGATLVAGDRRRLKDPEALFELCTRERVTHLTLPPAYLSPLEGRVPPVRALILAGEAPAADDALRCARQLACFNAYGPTEASVCASMHRVDPGAAYPEGIPLGQPVRGTRMLLLDASMQPVPPGVAGEICLEGVGLARGYLGDPARTAERFAPSPFAEGQRLYRTGDLAKRLPSGELLYLGRRDEQVKIRGHRVEPREIAERLLEHPEVAAARVVARAPSAGAPKELCAYYTRRPRVELWPSVAEFFVYDDVLYRSMAGHQDRNELYRRAFARALPGRTVLEIGPGPEAVLSKLAIEAGAARVYAVELLEETYQKARRHVAERGLSDRIIVLRGDILEAELPEPADCCISEIVGTLGGSEGAARLINGARRFLRQPDGMIPARSTTRLAACSLTEDLFEWGFAALPAHYVRTIFEQAGGAFDLRLCLKSFPRERLLSTDDVLEDLDYRAPVPLESRHEIHLRFERAGRFTGFLCWLTLELDAETRFDGLASQSSWLPLYLPVDLAGLEVRPGDSIEARIERRLSSNGLNPDFVLEGRLLRAGAPPLELRCESPHCARPERRHPFYERLLPAGQVPELPPLAKALRSHCAATLTVPMIPAHFIELEAFPVLASGKVDVRALPEPAQVAPPAPAEGEEPRTREEAVLAEAWAAVLGQRRVGLHDDYFALGGDSLKAIQIAARVRQAGFKLDIGDLFRLPTVAALATALGPLARAAEQGSVAGEVPLMPVQRWFLETFEGARAHFNQSALLRAAEPLDPAALSKAVAALFEHHDALRLVVSRQGEGWAQRYLGLERALELEQRDWRGDPDGIDRLRARAAEQQSSFDLERGPLFKATLFRLDEGDHLFLAAHHLAVDGVSWRVLLEDLAQAYRAAAAGRPIALPPKTDSLRSFAAHLEREARRPELDAELPRWRSALEAPPPFAVDDPQGSRALRHRAKADLELSPERTRALLGEAAPGRAVELLLAALGRAVAEWAGVPEVLVHIEGHGREVGESQLDLSRTVGWCTSFYPARFAATGDPSADLRQASRLLRGAPRGGLGYGLLAYVAGHAELRQEVPVSFNFHGQLDRAQGGGLFSLVDLDTGPHADPDAAAYHELELMGVVADGRLRCSLAFSAARLRPERVARLAQMLERELERVAGAGVEPTPAAAFGSAGVTASELEEILA